MAEGFGARLKLRREAQQIELTAIAAETKIKRSLLEALERDDLSQWPVGIFRRAWLRTYAKAIGLDPDATVREFLEAHPDPEDIPADPQPAPASGEAAASHETTAPRFRGIVGAALESLSRRMRGSHGDETHVETPRGASPRRGEPSAHVMPSPAFEFDLTALARLCTKFGQVGSARDVQPLLHELAGILDATGLIVWLWHSKTAVLRPALVHGYSAGVVARLPAVSRDADNPTAASFRSGEVREIDGGGGSCGALVLPLLLRSRCVGVLAIELQPGRQLTDAARAVATIIAAALAQLVARSHSSEAKPPVSASRRQRLSPLQGSV